jgi:hypothetical protein
MARNVHHDVVVRALVADAWTITADPWRLTYSDQDLYVDLFITRDGGGLTARNQDREIAVEIQSFLHASMLRALEEAVGQYVVYRTIMARSNILTPLYMALAETVYRRLRRSELAQAVLTDLNIKLLIFDETTARITQWIG